MSRRTTFLTASVIAALVFAGSTPAQAADINAVKRAIVITVLNNLGVRPTAELIDALVNEIPMDVLDAGLVRQVGKALDSNGDASQIIGETVDSDGDGVPNESGATDASSEAEDEAEEDAVDEEDPKDEDAADEDAAEEEDPKDDDAEDPEDEEEDEDEEDD